MKLLAVDFETQDAEPRTTRVTEVGAYSLLATVGEVRENKGIYQFSERYKMSEFCYEPDYPKQDPFIVELTGITDDMLKNQGRPRKEVFRELIPLVEAADHVFAHKKAFDQVIFESTCEKLGLGYPTRRWICTLSEFEWPKKMTCHKLGHLAFEHGVFDKGVDRAKLHRAGDDAELLLQLVTEYYDLDEVLAYASSPWIYLKADILGPWVDAGKQKNIATKLGFSFERCKHTEAPSWPKTWVTRVKGMQKVDDIKEKVASSESPFRVAIIQGLN